MANKYISTTLPYVNADPHIGAAYEFVVADAMARYWRLLGHDVFFNTGTDEHGQKIAQKADEIGQSRQEYVDHYAGQFEKLRETLDLSCDNFIRTTDKSHMAAAQELWKRCNKAGDIYKKKYEGLYCVGCERFLNKTDLIDGLCPDHKTEPECVEEENYFFKLSNYQEYLEEYLSADNSILPDWRRNEALNFVKSGLEDFSISREKERLDWGVPVPDDDNQVMYVWFDALTNYISTLGWPEDNDGNFSKFWKEGETVQVAGKDQVRFQSIMWQAMLKSAGIGATNSIVYHGFINSGGHKMSKSLGNVINPYDLVEKYGTDSTRYLLLRHVHPFEDTDVTWEKLDEWYTANLVNGLGNLTARITKMAENYGVLYESEFSECVEKGSVSEFGLQNTLDDIWKDIGNLDEYIQREEPFKKIKTDEDAAKKDIIYLLTHLEGIAGKLSPFMPETSKIILSAIKDNKKPENLFARLS